MKAIVCKVCGCDFHGVKENHYISRDEQETGIVTLTKKQEPKWYDTFDCPNCGCQCVVQERKRPVEEDKLPSVPETLDTLAEEADKLMEDVKKDEEDDDPWDANPWEEPEDKCIGNYKSSKKCNTCGVRKRCMKLSKRKGICFGQHDSKSTACSECELEKECTEETLNYNKDTKKEVRAKKSSCNGDDSSCKNCNKSKTTKPPNGVKSYEGICEECNIDDESICKNCGNRRFNSKFKNKGDSL